MGQLWVPFDWQRVVVLPWTEGLAITAWIVLMGFFVTAACGLVGNYLLLRRMALVGDAISHSLLFGLVAAFLLFHRVSTPLMFAAAVTTGILTVVIIEWIHRQSRVKPDAAICITFTVLFAAGVALLSAAENGGGLHLDAECVLYGEIAFVALEPPFALGGLVLGPESVVRMGGVLVGVILLIAVFYKELLITSFDPGLAVALGVRAGVWHYGLMAVLSIVIVSAFQAVGAILAVAMLIVPPMFAAQLSDQLVPRLWLTCLHAALSSLLGFHLSEWFGCSAAGAMVVAGAGLFCAAWVATSAAGRWRRIKQARSWSEGYAEAG